MIHACHRAALAGCHVLIMCPTGTLVHSYRDRVPDHPNIVIETIHSALVIKRQYDSAVQYAPPSRLRRYDLIMIDEVSQIDDELLEKLRMAISELPQRPVLLLSGDFYQLGPMAGQRAILQWIYHDFTYETLTECFRTNDPTLRNFLTAIRSEQPSRDCLEEFFRGRRLPRDLHDAVLESMNIARQRDQHFVWLTVTNKGAEAINEAAVRAFGITEDLLATPSLLFGDPKVHAGKIYPKVGVMVRLTRNLDKDRGFVNGAFGEIVDVLSMTIFSVKLSSGTMVLVHPIVEEWRDEDGGTYRRSFLPCSYGYSTTIRRAQGSTMDLGALYFDHTYPPDCGYGYVAASRFRSAAGIYLYGRIRRTDFLPALAKKKDLKDKFQYFRSALSEPDENEIMSAADERSFDRFAALHEQAALSRNDGEQDDICFDFSDCDSQGPDLEDPSMAIEAPVEPASALEEGEADLDEVLFSLG